MPSKAPVAMKRRRTEELQKSRPKKKVRKVKRQLQYHSSSDEEDAANEDNTDFTAVHLQDSEDDDIERNISILPVSTQSNVQGKDGDTQPDAEQEDESEAQRDASDSESGSASSTSNASASASATQARQKRKRNDPSAFASSITAITSSKLTTSQRSDPILARSAAASNASREVAESRLDARARRKLKDDRTKALERGRETDLLGLESTQQSTQEIMERERRLKKTAQRGVVKLFNAVRAAQVRGEQAEREARTQGVVGMGKREEKVLEMSKEGFLGLIAGGGKRSGNDGAAIGGVM